MSARIHILSDSLINQIAAGEVIERPASVVKELIENSIDAGARRIEVELEAGGRASIRVTDDGVGMHRDDALLCFQRHATSKIRDTDDLFSVTTLGFRGEAIPSIAEISRFELRTGERGALTGTEVVLDGGHIERCDDVANPGGTEVRVRRLFFNTPVRLKFLKTPATELGYVTDLVERLALSRPDLGFRLLSDGRTILDAPPDQDPYTRCVLVFGREAAPHLRAIDTSSGDLRLRGWYSDPSFHKAASSSMALFVNGRAVKDKTMTGAVLGAYRGVIPRGRYPVCALFLDLPGDRVDHNVHPAKSEVRFRDPGAIWGFFRARLSEGWKDLGAGHWAEPEVRRADDPSSMAPIRFAQPTQHERPTKLASPEPRGPLGQLWDRSQPSWTAPIVATAQADLVASHSAAPAETIARGETDETASPTTPAASPNGGLHAARFVDLIPLGQYGGTFILCQQGADLVVIDQHAAHERVVFEDLRRAQEGPPLSQRLLVPELVELDRAAVHLLADRADLLATLGLEVAEFGQQCLAVHALPAGVDIKKARRLLRDIADELRAGQLPRAPDQLRYQLASVCACHTAVRAGDRLSTEEIRGLFRELDRVDFSFACPHGRPIMVKFERREVERWFVRD